MSTIILGAGSIGCFLGGVIASQGERVTLLGRPAILDPIAQQGLRIAIDDQVSTIDPANYVLTDDQAALGQHDRVLVTVKGTATESVAELLRHHARPEATIISFQNGVRNAHKMRSWLANTVLAGMVPFNVVQQETGLFRQMTSGHLYLQEGTPEGASLAALFRQAGLPTELRSDMERVLWSKLVLNLNNAVNALSGIPLKTMLLDADFRWVLAQAQQEALTMMRASGYPTCRIGRLIPQTLPYALRLPTPLFRLVARPSLSIDPEASSSMQDDLKAGRLTEVDLLNGEIVRLADKLRTMAPVNSALRALIHQAESEGKAYLPLSGKQLRSQVQAALKASVSVEGR
ncbi:MAG: 2-dehydropantoate 2-reductase [Hahellaceae bacterium]|nr:2-dehydropantoate 2-reductase [Hahellaceae bacterium]